MNDHKLARHHRKIHRDPGDQWPQLRDACVDQLPVVLDAGAALAGLVAVDSFRSFEMPPTVCQASTCDTVT